MCVRNKHTWARGGGGEREEQDSVKTLHAHCIHMHTHTLRLDIKAFSVCCVGTYVWMYLYTHVHIHLQYMRKKGLFKHRPIVYKRPICTKLQCCGSGSVCFWACRIPIRWSLVRIQIHILLSSSKNSKKSLDCYCLVTSLWLFIFEK